MLDGVKPRSEHLLLRRIVINSVPDFGSDGENFGCCPYIQVFKNSKLIATAVPAVPENTDVDGNKKNSLTFLKIGEESVSFPVDCVVSGDILVRCRHTERSGKKEEMFRAAFHTGYVPCGVLRLTKTQLDGANIDDRIEDIFYIDLIFGPVEKSDSNSTLESTG